MLSLCLKRVRDYLSRFTAFLSVGERVLLVAVLALLVAFNVASLATGVSRYRDGRASPATRISVDLKDAFPRFSLLFCPFSGSVRFPTVLCATFNATNVPTEPTLAPFKPCSTTLTWHIAQQELDCEVVGPLSFERAEKFTSFALTAKLPPEAHGKPLSVTIFDPARGPPQGFAAFSGQNTVTLDHDARGNLAATARILDRREVGGSRRVEHKLFANLYTASSVFVDEYLGFVITPPVALDYHIETLKFVYPYSVYDILSSSAAVLSLSIAVFTFLFLNLPLARRVRVFRFGRWPEVWDPFNGKQPPDDGAADDEDVPLGVTGSSTLEQPLIHRGGVHD